MEAVAEFFTHNDTGWFSVDWYVGRRCNFDCTYCPSYLHDNYSKHVSYDNMKKSVDIITEKHGTNVYWSLSGGEPTVNPDFMKIDVEGAELDVLKGANKCLRNILGVEIESCFFQLRKNQPLVNDVIKFLSNEDFEFIDFLSIIRWFWLISPILVFMDCNILFI